MKRPPLFILIFFISIYIFPVTLGICCHRPAPQSDVSAPPVSPGAEPITINSLDTKTNTVKAVNLEEYLPGVLAAEMPASYETEALKAQAVAARSYILSKLDKENPEHPDAAICTNPAHCKGWLSESDAKAKWSADEQTKYWQKLCSAVKSTEGEYLVYEDDIVEACFFSSGGSRTENSEDVWQASLPYLRSVENPEPADSTVSRVTFTNSDFMQKLTPHLNSNNMPSAPTFSDINRTRGGSVATIVVCGKTFKGTEIRSIFGLKSANFTVTASPDGITFEVTGNGHGVGMSQKGANQMAKDGKKYTEILLHYYTNIQIVKM